MPNLSDNPAVFIPNIFPTFSTVPLFAPDSKKKKKTNWRLAQDRLAVETAFVKPQNNGKNKQAAKNSCNLSCRPGTLLSTEELVNQMSMLPTVTQFII